jgi:ABC-type polysaccharide/polyol phosphate transport system ATPase subunit
MKPILEVSDLSKKYRITRQLGSYLSLRDRIAAMFSFNGSNNRGEDFWALDHISFTVARGESVGIIGKNGAGKSTLLKILSKITSPSSGRIVTRGRIASLLEVGTGFHQELTGRENVFLNGSLLGMKRREILQKFDSIIDFSGTEKFLDTPLKHYSSGMQLRLAFSVAAFLEPEIMIIDEVLAVGDAEFQKKCLGKMEDVSHSGRTILFVSHDLDSVERLCKRSILLSKGKIVGSGPSSEVIKGYLSDTQVPEFREMKLTEDVMLVKFSLPEMIYSGNNFSFTIGLRKLNSKHFMLTDLSLLFYNYKKQRVAIFDMRHLFNFFKEDGGLIEYTGNIANFNLIEGIYYAGLFYGVNSIYGDAFEICSINVRREQNKYDIIPYEIQHRGYVELS